jgi:predicted kinase
MKTLVAMVGLPRSGKSTWARRQGFPIVNPDAIRLAIHGQAFVGLAEPFVWAVAKAMVRALFIAGHDTVILDATNTTRKRRDEWKSSDWTLAFMHIDTPAIVCHARAARVGETAMEDVIERMSRQFEPLADDEQRYGETQPVSAGRGDSNDTPRVVTSASP